MESMATISAFRCAASSRASRLLPEPVGPVRIMELVNVSGLMGAPERIMPTFAIVQRFGFPLPAVFDFFRRPANSVAVAPPELHLLFD